MATNLTNVELQTAFIGLSVAGTLFSALSALFGKCSTCRSCVYVVLFVLAIWATFKNRTTANNKLRIITIMLFLFESAHYISRCVIYAQRRSTLQPQDSPFAPAFSVPALFVGSFATTTAGLLADGILVWRFWVIFGHSKWALYVPATAVIVNALLGLSSDFQIFTFYENLALYNRLYLVGFQINAAWGWMMFTINTVLTGLIIARIVYISNRLPSGKTRDIHGGRYPMLITGIVESGLVTWIGLLLYGIATIAPTGHVTMEYNIGFVMICIIPIFFGISQCLIIVHISLSTAISVCAANSKEEARTSRYHPKELGIKIQCDIHTDTKSSPSVDGSIGELDVVEMRLDCSNKVQASYTSKRAPSASRKIS